MPIFPCCSVIKEIDRFRCFRELMLSPERYCDIKTRCKDTDETGGEMKGDTCGIFPVTIWCWIFNRTWRWSCLASMLTSQRVPGFCFHSVSNEKSPLETCFHSLCSWFFHFCGQSSACKEKSRSGHLLISPEHVQFVVVLERKSLSLWQAVGSSTCSVVSDHM